MARAWISSSTRASDCAASEPMGWHVVARTLSSKMRRFSVTRQYRSPLSPVRLLDADVTRVDRVAECAEPLGQIGNLAFHERVAVEVRQTEACVHEWVRSPGCLIPVAAVCASASHREHPGFRVDGFG